MKLLLTLAIALSGCSTCAYYYDGGATARPFYKACSRGGTVTVMCDSPNRLPNKDCK